MTLSTKERAFQLARAKNVYKRVYKDLHPNAPLIKAESAKNALLIKQLRKDVKRLYRAVQKKLGSNSAWIEKARALQGSKALLKAKADDDKKKLQTILAADMMDQLIAQDAADEADVEGDDLDFADEFPDEFDALDEDIADIADQGTGLTLLGMGVGLALSSLGLVGKSDQTPLEALQSRLPDIADSVTNSIGGTIDTHVGYLASIYADAAGSDLSDDDIQSNIDVMTERQSATVADTTFYDVLGQTSLQVMKANDAQQKRVLTADDDLVCPVCLKNEAAGWIDINDQFPSGDDEPEFHPRCRCELLTNQTLDDGDVTLPGDENVDSNP